MKSQQPLTLTHETSDEVEAFEQDTELNFNRAPLSSHEYRQQGDKVYCIGCGIYHGKHYPPGWKLTGTKDGVPVMVKVW
jgi:hypothetical protein